MNTSKNEFVGFIHFRFMYDEHFEVIYLYIDVD